MKKVWYGSDEVKGFHPIIEECLNDVLHDLNIDGEYTLKHHFGDFTRGIPDFLLMDSRTNDVISVIEVKKTPLDVLGSSAGIQAKDYAEELGLNWKPGFHPHFCVTNIEITQFFCYRENSTLIGCLLEDSPVYSGDLSDDNTYLKFKEFFRDYFTFIISKEEPKFSKQLEAISESFTNSFYNISDILTVNLNRIYHTIGFDEEKIKESILYELLRFAFYFYIREYYKLNKFYLIDYFTDFDFKDNSSDLLDIINKNFSRAMEIDFKDILNDYDSNYAIIPNILKDDETVSEIFKNFILTLQDNIEGGVKKNSNTIHFVSLLTENIYDKEEMHEKGKIMSDEILSDLLSFLIIDSYDSIVIDPCCGDGNLLMSAYNRLKHLYEEKDIDFAHNDLLKQLYGIEEDPNLIQLTSFKLICNDLLNVNQDTYSNLYHMDLFECNLNNKFDALVMNPPFLRNQSLDQNLKRFYLRNIEENLLQESFIRNVSQPDKYYYFIEKAISLLNDNGKASMILKTKFLNNKDGIPLKEFLIDYLDAIIAYPANFFSGFAITTCILVLSKNTEKDFVSFINIKDTDFLSNFNNVKSLIDQEIDIINEEYTLKVVKKSTINPKDNWLQFLIDPLDKFKNFENLDILNNLTDYFEIIERGKAGNSGGSAVVFPFSNNNPLIDYASSIEDTFIGYGIQRNKISNGRRKFILTEDCLNNSQGLMLPLYDSDAHNGISNAFSKFKGLNEYCDLTRLKEKADIDFNKWKRIFLEDNNSQVVPKILIPRGDRKKHSIYYYPFDEDVLISTNFFYLSKFTSNNSKITEEKQIMFIVAFLLSSFGQLQFEIHSNNHEGNRKLEKFMLEKFKVLDLNLLTDDEIISVVDEFIKLNELDQDVEFEKERYLRRNLDLAIGKLIFERNNLGFVDSEELVDFFEEFNLELIDARLNNESS